MQHEPLPRPISLQEAAVIRAVISRCPCKGSLPLESYPIDGLEVDARCKCGCDSVFFGSYDSAHPPTIIADGLGYSEAGEEMNIILWAYGDRIVHLELSAHSVNPASLPLPDSVCAFEDARKLR